MALDGGYGARNGAKDAPINRSNSSGVNINIGEDFPILCETCLGPNPYVRMVKLPYGSKLCKISNAPYQSFRWKAGPAGRYKETIICYTVAKERNICQTCLNDMQFGLPVGVRDKILKKADSEVGVPRSIVGSQYFYEQQARMVDYATPGNFSEDQQNAGPSRDLQKFSKTLQAADSRGKTAFRNLPKLCSFWVGGVCSRVLRKSCPFRPCCGTYLFPELAATHRDMCSDLIARLKAQGPDAVQKSLDKEVRLALKDSQKGNKDDAIKKRVFGEDDLTNRMSNCRCLRTRPFALSGSGTSMPTSLSRTYTMRSSPMALSLVSIWLMPLDARSWRWSHARLRSLRQSSCMVR